MSDHDEAAIRLEERKAEIRAKLEARAKAAEDARLERLASEQARAEAKAEARAKAKIEAQGRSEARARASAEAKAAELAKAQERAEARALAQAAAQEEARVRAEAKALSRTQAQPVVPADLTGRQRLIDAAMRLHAEKRSFASLGIREIAREANLNPNTFYRHFESIDDLAVAAVMQCGERLRPMLHQIQRLASRVDPVTVAALEVSAFYAFALGNPDAFVVGVTEYHGGSPRVRESIAGLLQDVSNEMRDDIAGLGIFPTISRENLEIACKHIAVHLFHLSQDYIEKPEQREYIIESSECMIVWMFAGAMLGAPTNIVSLNRALAADSGP
jgi:TetR/AcrR family transcriptional regulator, fatty acid biosynthesis regulator